MKSKKKLFEALDEFYGVKVYSTQGLDAPGIGDETYGRESFIYVDTQGRRGELERFLRGQGFTVNTNYSKGSDFTEVAVSYFKGHHWNH